jgi:signal transduction histidine kinase
VRIARDLHDDLGAGLTQISLNTALVQNPAVTSEVAGGLLQEIDQRSRELVTALDEIVWAVNPKNDTVPSLARYLCQFAQQSLLPGGIVCRLEVALDLPDAPVGAEQRHNLFLAFKEALNNTLRHSGAREVRLEIVRDGRTLSVTLADNGRGFALGPVVADSDGLVNMRARLAALGGSCVVTSEPGRGTTVVLRLPLAGIFHKRTSERTVQ